MSKNAKRFHVIGRQQPVDVDSSFSAPGAFGQEWGRRYDPTQGHPLGIFNPYAARAGEIRACSRLTAAMLRPGETVAVRPVREIVEAPKGHWSKWVEAPSGFTEHARFVGPWLTGTATRDEKTGGLRPRRVPRESSSEQVEGIERQRALVGWLNTAAKLAEEMRAKKDFLGLRALEMFFRAGVIGDGGGPNSPYCSHVLMKDVVGKMSPGRLVRRMIEVRFSAIRRMRPFVGVVKNPSWSAVAVAAVSRYPIGKASIVATALTLWAPRLDSYSDTFKDLCQYTGARDWLARHLGRSSDQVEELERVTTITQPPEWVHSLEVSRTVELRTDKSGRVGAGGRYRGWIGRVGTFVYHTDNSWIEISAKQFAKVLIQEYRKHISAIAAEVRCATLRKMITAGRVTVLATRQDSYDAGNCGPGTEAFIRARGLSTRHWVDANYLAGSGEYRAVAAANIAVRRFEEWVTRNNVSVA